MSMFKGRVLLYLECNRLAMQEIRGELRIIREEKEIQTTLLRRIAENQTNSNKETNKAQDLAPAPKEITWQEAVNALAMHCCNTPCTKCEAIGWCRDFRQKHPCSWYIPHDKVEVPADE